MKKYYLHKWGFTFNKLSVTWYDAWAKEVCLEIVFGNALLINL